MKGIDVWNRSITNPFQFLQEEAKMYKMWHFATFSHPWWWKSEKSNRKFGSYKHNFDVIHLLINWYPLSHDIWWLFFRYKNLSLLIAPKIKQKTHQISIFHKCLMKYYMIHTWYQTNLNIDISYNTWVLDYSFKNSIKYNINEEENVDLKKTSSSLIPIFDLLNICVLRISSMNYYATEFLCYFFVVSSP